MKLRHFLPGSIERAGADWTPFIATDESYYIFSSGREGGFGICDLYISFKRADGKYLLFNSTRKIAGAGAKEPGNGAGDVYWIDAKIIEELRPKASN